MPGLLTGVVGVHIGLAATVASRCRDLRGARAIGALNGCGRRKVRGDWQLGPGRDCSSRARLHSAPSLLFYFLLFLS